MNLSLDLGTITVKHDFSSLGVVVEALLSRILGDALNNYKVRASFDAAPDSPQPELAKQAPPTTATQDTATPSNSGASPGLEQQVPPASPASPASPAGLAPKPRRGRPSKEQKEAAKLAEQAALAAAEKGEPLPLEMPPAAAPVAAPAAPAPAAVPAPAPVAATAPVAAPAAPAPTVTAAPVAAPTLTGASDGTASAEQIAAFRKWISTVFLVAPGCGSEAYDKVRAEHGDLTMHTAPLSKLNAFRAALEARMRGETAPKPEPAPELKHLAGF